MHVVRLVKLSWREDYIDPVQFRLPVAGHDIFVHYVGSDRALGIIR